MTGAGPATDAPDACESCGSVEDGLVVVRRVYVTPESWDTAGHVEAGDEEWWCFVCRTHYPHQEPVGPDGAPDHGPDVEGAGA